MVLIMRTALFRMRLASLSHFEASNILTNQKNPPKLLCSFEQKLIYLKKHVKSFRKCEVKSRNTAICFSSLSFALFKIARQHPSPQDAQKSLNSGHFKQTVDQPFSYPTFSIMYAFPKTAPCEVAKMYTKREYFSKDMEVFGLGCCKIKVPSPFKSLLYWPTWPAQRKSNAGQQLLNKKQQNKLKII